MGIEKEAVYRRIRQNRAYNQERMEVLLGIIYRNSETALERWQRMVHKFGFDKALKKQRKNAACLGKLRGISTLGFYASRDRKKMMYANSEFQKNSRTWYGSVLEAEEVNTRQHREMAQERNEKNSILLSDARNSIASQLQDIRNSTQQGADEVQKQC